LVVVVVVMAMASAMLMLMLMTAMAAVAVMLLGLVSTIVRHEAECASLQRPLLKLSQQVKGSTARGPAAYADALAAVCVRFEKNDFFCPHPSNGYAYPLRLRKDALLQ
jgi:hypothetical protein